jgi:hypothetical protein
MSHTPCSVGPPAPDFPGPGTDMRGLWGHSIGLFATRPQKQADRFLNTGRAHLVRRIGIGILECGLTPPAILGSAGSPSTER